MAHCLQLAKPAYMYVALSADDVQKTKEAMEVVGRLVESAGPSGASHVIT